MFAKSITVIACFFFMTPAFAMLDLSVTKGVNAAMPIAIVPFAKDSAHMAAVIATDLQRSGQFNVTPFQALPSFPINATTLESKAWRDLPVDYVVMGEVSPLPGEQLRVDTRLYDSANIANDIKNAGGNQLDPVILHQSFTIKTSQTRTLAHHLSDAIYEKLTGVRGVFSTRVAYVLKTGVDRQLEYRLMIADFDGEGAKPILISSQAIMSPAWSPDGKQLAYVSFEDRVSSIYVVEVATGTRRLVSKFPGINGAPAWSPDGEHLALVLSKSGSPNIYSFDLRANQLQKITEDGFINTEPSFSKEGASIIFTSNRDGSPQIYEIQLANHEIQRLTYIGNYNARASFTPDGQHIIFLHREEGEFTIAKQDLNTGELTLIVKAKVEESPGVSPNGQMVVYATAGGHLAMASMEGRMQFILPTPKGNVQEPAWAPFLN